MFFIGSCNYPARREDSRGAAIPAGRQRHESMFGWPKSAVWHSLKSNMGQWFPAMIVQPAVQTSRCDCSRCATLWIFTRTAQTLQGNYTSMKWPPTGVCVCDCLFGWYDFLPLLSMSSAYPRAAGLSLKSPAGLAGIGRVGGWVQR